MAEPVNGFEFLEKLKERNGKKTQNFLDYSRYLDYKAREKGVPIQGQFELTPLCNFSCKMCYVHLTPDQLSKQILSVETWKDIFLQAWKAGMIRASLTGGECLAYPGFDELYLYLHSLGCEVHVLTNGFLLDDRRIEFFKKHMPAMIQVSLYGWNDDVYERVTGQRAFKTVTENIRKAIDEKLPIIVNVTPNRYLGEDVLETIRVTYSLSKNVRINSAIFEPREETGRSEQMDDPEIDQYVKIYRLINELSGIENVQVKDEDLPPAGGMIHECKECGLKCGAGRSSFTIDWRGNMIPCNRLYMIHGDPVIEGFSTVWSRINQDANNWPRVPECESCAYEKICNNCAANMLRFAKPGERPIQICERTLAFVRNGIVHIPDCEE